MNEEGKDIGNNYCNDNQYYKKFDFYIFINGLNELFCKDYYEKLKQKINGDWNYIENVYNIEFLRTTLQKLITKQFEKQTNIVLFFYGRGFLNSFYLGDNCFSFYDLYSIIADCKADQSAILMFSNIIYNFENNYYQKEENERGGAKKNRGRKEIKDIFHLRTQIYPGKHFFTQKEDENNRRLLFSFMSDLFVNNETLLSSQPTFNQITEMFKNSLHGIRRGNNDGTNYHITHVDIKVRCLVKFAPQINNIISMKKLPNM